MDEIGQNSKSVIINNGSISDCGDNRISSSDQTETTHTAANIDVGAPTAAASVLIKVHDVNGAIVGAAPDYNDSSTAVHIIDPGSHIIKFTPAQTGNYNNNAAAQYQSGGGGAIRPGLTPYFQQVDGKPVYIEGYAPAPANANQSSSYRRRRDDDEESLGQAMYPNNNLFINKTIRNRFVQRVYTILFVQLAISFGFVFLCLFQPQVSYFVKHNLPLMIVAVVVFLLTYIVLGCFMKARRIFPLNFILLGVMTISSSYWLGVISSNYDTYIVLGAVGITCLVCLLISIFAIQTSCDITGCGMYLCVAGTVVVIFGCITMFVMLFTNLRIMFIIYSALMALLFCMYLMYDTQQIMGGRKIELSPEEYIQGALSLYIDVIYIFISILGLCGASNS